ncbi:MAG: CocE/NonD family hydrolase [Candidatus Krumholzibacteriia bacterium]
MSRRSILLILILLAFSAVRGPSAWGAADTLDQRVFPLNVLQDSAKFTIYVNEEPVATIVSSWRAGGGFAEDITVALGGQSISASIEIECDDGGIWRTITIKSPRGDAVVTREGMKASIKAGGNINTVDLKPGTVLFENSSPALMSQAVCAYDAAKGGKQTFPVFIVPAIVLEASLERLETAERFIMGEPRTFTLYRYGLPGVDLIVWVDENNRLCLADVPAQRAAYVREGYEALRGRAETDSLLSRPEFEVAVEKNVMVRMRDGKKLATDVYKPAADGKFPVILIRTPYGKDMSELKARFYARRGYVFAVQDCRGRFASEGSWNPFFNEPKDGYDTIEWLAAQPWSNGKVGMIGASYLGWVQWWAAREAPPHLATIIPNVAPPDPYFNIPYEYGSFFLLGAIWWADVLEQEATADLSGKAMSAVNEKKYAKLLRHLPVIDLDKKVLGRKNRYWREWIKHPDNDAYWRRASFLEDLGNFTSPVYHQSGWFDGDGIGSKLNYLAMARFGRATQKLVLGPWGHTDAAARRGPGDRDFGPNAIIDLEGSYLRWLDRRLKGIENGIDKEPLVALFVMNTNRWLTGPSYPLPETKFTKLYLASGGAANTSKGDGRLGFDAPAAGSPSDSYVYDPADPTPDPGFYTTPEDLAGEETRDSTKTVSVEEEREKVFAYHGKVDEERSDILVYETAPMSDSLVVAGPVSAVIYASSSAKDTDFFVRLSEIDEKGRVFPLVHGTIRARYRESFSKPTLLAPGEIYEYRLDLWQTGVTIPKGRKLRVEVASAAFPTFSRNLNTGKHNETETKFVKATQKIHHDARYPSHVLLPVIEKPDFKDQLR